LLEHDQRRFEARDHAMLAMLIGCGLRRDELLVLTLESLCLFVRSFEAAVWPARRLCQRI
jgi:site-specific recombinase XerD